MVGMDANDEEISSSRTTLKKEKERVQRLVNQVKEEIEKIKRDPPYIWKFYLEDENKKSERITELKEELKSFQEAVRTQEEEIHQLMGNDI